MTLRKIRAILYEQGISQKAVALHLGISPSTVRVVLSGHGTSRRVREAVARLLNMSYEKLWGNHKKAA